MSKPTASSARMTRWFLIGTLLASCGLAVNGFLLHRKRVDLQDALDQRVPNLAKELEVNARKYTRLYSEAEGAGLTGQKDPMSYLRLLAKDKDVVIGATDIQAQPKFTPVKGVVDEKFLIRPTPRDRLFPRTNLANFMHLIEQRSRRMRVTMVRMTREGKPRENEYGTDRWTWEIEVTSRQKEGAE